MSTNQREVTIKEVCELATRDWMASFEGLATVEVGDDKESLVMVFDLPMQLYTHYKYPTMYRGYPVLVDLERSVFAKEHNPMEKHDECCRACAHLHREWRHYGVNSVDTYDDCYDKEFTITVTCQTSYAIKRIKANHADILENGWMGYPVRLRQRKWS